MCIITLQIDMMTILAQTLTYQIHQKKILDSVDMLAQSGEYWVILGPNGAGKSTLLHLLAGIKPLQTGSISWCGKSLAEISPRQMATQRTILSQHQTDTAYFSVGEVVMMGRYPHFGWKPRQVDRAIVGELLGELGLADLADRPCQTLSGGERQRVHFARSLAQIYDQPSGVIFLDEPTNHLDPAFQIELLRSLRPLLARGFVVISVMHDLNMTSQFADHVLLLKDGQALAQGPLAEVMTRERLTQAYQTNVTQISQGKHRFWVYTS